ncbi:hypothetical protein DITRI_Ditri09bG0077300 [Diplodiscus trichospermus]
MPLRDLYDPLYGYLRDDTCLIEADVLVPRPNDSVRDSGCEELSQQDIDTFFENLESEIETTETVSSQKVKEALAKVEEPLDIILGQSREMFEACKNSKLELNSLRKEWSEYEAR